MSNFKTALGELRKPPVQKVTAPFNSEETMELWIQRSRYETEQFVDAYGGNIQNSIGVYGE